MSAQSQAQKAQAMDGREKAVKRILISQPEPARNSPYHEIAKKYKVEVDFRPFIQVEGLDVKEFRRQKVKILDHTAIILTSRNAVDHFFRLCDEIKVEVPADMKYFCISEQTANYLQKYIVLRKRKIFTGHKTAKDLFPLFQKHKTEKYLYPCSDIRKDDIPNFMKEHKLSYKEAIMYRTVSSDLSDLSDVNYDLIAFFSPSGINSLLENFPDFKQNNTRIAAFGPTTAKAVKDNSLLLDVEAPSPDSPSMAKAIELYLDKVNK